MPQRKTAFFKNLSYWKIRLLVFFSVIGPGIITGTADNDAGGIATYTRGMDYGARSHEAVAMLHEELVAMVQIENRAALEDVDGIAATDGVDLLFVGPFDLSHALGIPGQFDHPDMMAALDRVSAAARTHHKAAGLLVMDSEDVGGYAEKGFTFFSIATEANILGQAASESFSAAHETYAEATASEVV